MSEKEQVVVINFGETLRGRQKQQLAGFIGNAPVSEVNIDIGPLFIGQFDMIRQVADAMENAGVGRIPPRSVVLLAPLRSSGQIATIAITILYGFLGYFPPMIRFDSNGNIIAVHSLERGDSIGKKLVEATPANLRFITCYNRPGAEPERISDTDSLEKAEKNAWRWVENSSYYIGNLGEFEDKGDEFIARFDPSLIDGQYISIRKE